MPDVTVPKRYNHLMWGLDTRDINGKYAWWWWFWLFFFKDKNNRPRQLMVLWSSKNSSQVKVRDHLWKRRYLPKKKGKKITFHGLICSWFFDGSRMNDPLFIIDTPISTWSNSKGGGLSGVNEKEYSFYGKPEKYSVKFRNEEFDMVADLTPDGPMSEHIHNRRTLPFGMFADIFKARRYGFEGDLMMDGGFEHISGTCYFQKILINMPAVPWYWGVVHTEKGYYIDYINPHVGLPVLRKEVDHTSSLDRMELGYKPNIDLYDPKTKKLITFKMDHFEKRYKSDLPIFKISGSKGTKTIEMELSTYSRAHWSFVQPGIRQKTFYYNEYPARLTRFDCNLGSRKIGMKDLGASSSNCEHAWGMLY